jgi:hypothetical protein
VSLTLSYGSEVGIVTGLSSGIVLAVAPAVRLRLITSLIVGLVCCGAIVVLFGSLFQTLQYVLPLFCLSTM